MAHSMEQTFILILVLLAIAVGITAVAKKINIPYPIALVAVGAILGMVNLPALDNLKDLVVGDEVFRFIIISIFLPTLLGEATLKLPFEHLLENRKPILALALAGTLISYAVVGFLALYFLHLSPPVAFVFAALMAATDPVSVLSIFKSMGVPQRLAVIMEGESLINDGVAVVLFKISSVSLSAYMAAGLIGVGEGLLEFAVASLGGLLIGAGLAYLFSQIIRFYDDYPLEIIMSMVLFYSSFFIAETVHVSGVIAVVTAGLIFGNYGARIGMSPTTKLSIKTFWDVAALIANSLVFLMVGLEIARMDLGGKWGMIIAAIAFVLAARSISVYVSLSFLRNIPLKWKHVFNWGGLRGSLSIALALSLPPTFQGREEVLLLSFGVVLFSLVVQGLTVKPLVNTFGLSKDGETREDYQRTISEIQRYLSGQKSLEGMRRQATVSPFIFNKINDEYRSQLEEAYRKLEELYSEQPHLQEEQMKHARRNTRYAEHEAVNRLAKHEIISDQIAEEQRKTIVDLIQKDGENE